MTSSNTLIYTCTAVCLCINALKGYKQICIPVGCVPPASVGTTRCQSRGSVQRVSVRLCPGESLSGESLSGGTLSVWVGGLCPGGLCPRAGVSVQGVSPEGRPSPSLGQNDTHFWKHYLRATSLTGGKNWAFARVSKVSDLGLAVAVYEKYIWKHTLITKTFDSNIILHNYILY